MGNRKSSRLLEDMISGISSGITSNQREMLRNRKQTPSSPNPENNRKWKTSMRISGNTGDSVSLLGVDTVSANSTIVSLRNQGTVIFTDLGTLI